MSAKNFSGALEKQLCLGLLDVVFRKRSEHQLDQWQCHHCQKYVHLQKCLKSTEDGMEVVLSKVLFMDKSLRTLDGSDDLSKGSVVNGRYRHQCLKHQKRRRGLIWAGTIGVIWVVCGKCLTVYFKCLYSLPERSSYTLVKKQRITFEWTIVFIQDNVMHWPGQKCHSRWCTGRKWHILMALMRGNRVGRNWLMKWD